MVTRRPEALLGATLIERQKNSTVATASSELSVINDISQRNSIPRQIVFSRVCERRKKKPYKELTLEEKVQLIRMAEENTSMSQASIAERYSIAKSNVCRILQRKHEYIRAYESAGFAGSRKRKLRSDSDAFSMIPPNKSSFLKVPLFHQAKTPHLPGDLQLSIHLAESNLDPIQERHNKISDKNLGNETLRAHMYKQHQISRMFMCRCCNWAFPDKTSLHMHMQAKEEGKTISVPVIGKGNPPTQQSNCNGTVQHNGTSSQIPTLHAPQPRIPSLHNSSNPLIPKKIFFVIALHAAAAALFPQMVMLRGQSGSGIANDNILSKLHERLVLNNLLAQSGFGIAAWLANFPRMDCGISRVDTPNGGANSIKSEPEMNGVETDDEVNVDRDIEDDDKQKDLADIVNEHNNIPQKTNEKSQINEPVIQLNYNPRCEEKTASIWKSNGTSAQMGLVSSDENSLSLAPNIITKKVPAKQLSSDGEITSKPFDGKASGDSFMDFTTSENSQCDHSPEFNRDILHTSPSETRSSVSPSTECCDCSIYKRKLAAAISRCRYLEGKTAILQSDALRFNTKVSLSENSIRHAEQESQVLREQNELLQRKLLECQEKTLSFMQNEQNIDTQSIAIYLNDILKITFLR
ncbi:unnamed protein product [Dracunculus medinensis]|uniref:HTH psq-type domain-containing protein n=1 Tax=Dracunculus medinensis TaxID=318479 RepID=A0A0N4UJQ3_DRAME|nr:unnamed protein product [Dracunculus medinensis]